MESGRIADRPPASAPGRGGSRGARLLLAAAWLWVSCWASSAEPSPAERPQPSGQEGSRTISAAELERLSTISTRLAELNTRLRTELEDSRRSLAGLESSLETSTSELATLRSELEASRRDSSELVSRAESSERDSRALREALTRADGSLTSLEASFADYRRAAEARIATAGWTNAALVAAAVAGWAVAMLALLLR